jgi:IclR family transcriptional regulator, pca regulon regulatory protein
MSTTLVRMKITQRQRNGCAQPQTDRSGAPASRGERHRTDRASVGGRGDLPLTVHEMVPVLPRLERSPRLSESIDKGLAVLGCFARQRLALGVKDVSVLLGMAPATTQRYLATHLARGWLGQDTSRKYVLAPGALVPGIALFDEIAVSTGCDEILGDLRDRTGYTASLAVFDRPCATYVRRLHGHRRGQYAADLDLRAGAHTSLYCTALGKALLAILPRDLFADVLGELRLVRHGPRTIMRKRVLIEEIDHVRRSGLALSDEELAPGVRSIAAVVPIKFRGTWAALEVSVPASAGPAKRMRGTFGPHVLEAARRVSDCLFTNGVGGEAE